MFNPRMKMLGTGGTRLRTALLSFHSSEKGQKWLEQSKPIMLAAEHSGFTFFSRKDCILTEFRLHANVVFQQSFLG